ncbi:hypothetical protein QBC37DRAFT_187456 [Rhypophila decipiens]|uniref:Uncharacterized protein n=1 Tax=Rhypophila decipiens TaxID=261697 RepID=A0AAN6Y4X5_9PEZI|nr:hypothetical protein QBC37DRAFT_187456 [Rhypophila decipiens]
MAGSSSNNGNSNKSSSGNGKSNTSKNNSSSAGNGGANARTQPISDYEFLKPWGGMENFMNSHGLRMWNPEDVDEAHQIIDMMREQGGHGRSPYRS